MDQVFGIIQRCVFSRISITSDQLNDHVEGFITPENETTTLVGRVELRVTRQKCIKGPRRSLASVYCHPWQLDSGNPCRNDGRGEDKPREHVSA